MARGRRTRGSPKRAAKAAAAPPPEEEHPPSDHEEDNDNAPAAAAEPEEQQPAANAVDESMENDGMDDEEYDEDQPTDTAGRSGRGGRHAPASSSRNQNTTHDESEEEAAATAAAAEEPEEDESLLKILLSTDNHLGYNERDPIRGQDSFAALEEVLSLARQHKVDMVLLSGDLFHDNKPSRKTLHTTMDILRRYCMGGNSVGFQILSDQKECLRSVVSGRANYEDEFYSVDLPIFTIHGNHDDPTRDGGPELLSAVDLLSVSNLVNYFGRQDEVDNIKINPILIQKGDTKVALYGMGSMRDERLNRMWQGKKVKFLRPEVGGGDDDDEKGGWFNIFTLHQNRDLGRGSKNCVHESMIPEWMDLVVWGHEHESLVNVNESLVGTFRITQPGSSVATSLTAGESRRKQVGLLEIKEGQFRLKPLTLSQVRGFTVGEISLSEKAREQGGVLDEEDPKVEERMSEVLSAEVHALIQKARDEAEQLAEDAEKEAEDCRTLEDEFDDSDKPKRKYKIKQPEKVLVRLKVEHSGFSTLNNQRFGSQFVGQVANPADILLFHKRRQAESAKGGKGATKKKRSAAGLNVPTEPEDLADVNIEDLVTENLVNNEKKLELLDEKTMKEALEQFVDKKEPKAIAERTEKLLQQNQKILMKRSKKDQEDGGAAIDNPNAVREVLSGITGKKRAEYEMEKEEAEEEDEEKSTKKTKAKARKRANSKDSMDDSEEEAPPTKKRGRTATTSKKAAAKSRKKYDDSDEDMDFNDSDDEPPPPKKRATAKKTTAKKTKKARDDSDDDSDIEFMGKSQASSKPAARTGRTARATAKKPKYSYDSDEVEELDDDSEDEPSARGKKKSSQNTAKARAPSQTQSTLNTFTSTRKPAASRGARRNVQYLESDSDDDEPQSSFGGGGAWGTASQSTKGRSRR